MKKVVNKREQSAYHINITFPGGKFIQKTDLSLDGLFNTYFINLNNNLAGKNYTINDAESVMEKYDNLFKDCKITIQYVDTWGHRWKGKCAWPRREKFINYLKERIMNYET